MAGTYTTAEQLGIGESSPAVGRRSASSSATLSGVFHAVDTADRRSARWTFETLGEIKSSPVDRRRPGADRVVRRLPLRARDAAVPGSCCGSSKRRTTSTPRRRVFDGIAYFGGCDEAFHGVRISDGVEVVSLSAGAYTAASSAVISDGRAYFGTFDNEVDQGSTWPRTRTAVAVRAPPQRHFPFYSSALNGRTARW